MDFDRPLQPGPLQPATWSGRAFGREVIFQFLNAAGPTIIGSTRLGAFIGPGVYCSYTPPPFDVVSALGVPADPIVRFPWSLGP